MNRGKFYCINESESLGTKQVMGIQFGLDTALKSAGNLAKLTPGKTYYVMEAVQAVTAEIPILVEKVL